MVAVWLVLPSTSVLDPFRVMVSGWGVLGIVTMADAQDPNRALLEDISFVEPQEYMPAVGCEVSDMEVTSAAPQVIVAGLPTV